MFSDEVKSKLKEIGFDESRSDFYMKFETFESKNKGEDEDGEFGEHLNELLDTQLKPKQKKIESSLFILLEDGEERIGVEVVKFKIVRAKKSVGFRAIERVKIYVLDIKSST